MICNSCNRMFSMIIIMGLISQGVSKSAPKTKCGVNERLMRSFRGGVRTRNCQDWCPGHIAHCSNVEKFEACACKHGYLRDPTRQGACVAPEDCRRKSFRGRGQDLQESEFNVPIVNSNSDGILRAPTIEETTSTSSPIKKEPITCPGNEVYSDCVNSPPKCQAICPILERHFKRTCTEICQPGCRCADGYFRHPGFLYQCVLKSFCDRIALG